MYRYVEEKEDDDDDRSSGPPDLRLDNLKWKKASKALPTWYYIKLRTGVVLLFQLFLE